MVMSGGRSTVVYVLALVGACAAMAVSGLLLTWHVQWQTDYAEGNASVGSTGAFLIACWLAGGIVALCASWSLRDAPRAAGIILIITAVVGFGAILSVGTGVTVVTHSLDPEDPVGKGATLFTWGRLTLLWLGAAAPMIASGYLALGPLRPSSASQTPDRAVKV
jgi:hypothetical protein